MSVMDRIVSTELGPWSGFGPAAEAAIRHLNRTIHGLDLWLVTHVVDDVQVVVASAGAWAQLAPRGTTYSWQASFCVQMVEGHGPAVASNIADEPAYLKAAAGPLAKVKAYVGVPLLLDDGTVFGTLCALSGSVRPSSLAESLPAVTLAARLLSTILAGESRALARSEDAAHAYSLAERDPATGLRNHRGWQELLRREEARCALYGTAASVLVVSCAPHDDEASQDLRLRVAALLTDICPSSDGVCSVSRNEFAVLSVETDLVAARALAALVKQRVVTGGFDARIGVASRHDDETLTQTWARAVGEAEASR